MDGNTNPKGRGIQQRRDAVAYEMVCIITIVDCLEERPKWSEAIHSKEKSINE